MAAIHARNHFENAHPPTLAIYCSDGRFTRLVEELGANLGHARMDTLTIPGGPGVLAGGNRIGGFAEAHSFRKAAHFLIRSHATKDVILVAHEGCGYYKDRFPDRAPAWILERQKSELAEAARWLSSGDTPPVRIHRYLARISGHSVTFEPVD